MLYANRHHRNGLQSHIFAIVLVEKYTLIPLELATTATVSRLWNAGVRKCRKDTAAFGSWLSNGQITVLSGLKWFKIIALKHPVHYSKFTKPNEDSTYTVTSKLDRYPIHRILDVMHEDDLRVISIIAFWFRTSNLFIRHTVEFCPTYRNEEASEASPLRCVKTATLS